MSTAFHVENRTQGFARVLGPYLVVVAVVALARASEIPGLVTDFGKNPIMSWVSGAFVLLSGLTVVALHQRWHGVAAIVVSVLGWLATLKGVLLLAVPQSYAAFGESMVRAAMWWQVLMVAVGLLGLFLTYAGWAPANEPRTARTFGGPAPDLPSAA
ncbi:hypothetical protein [Mycolicibacterium smegmatis]|jgi:hypothetical protein|uniref:Uncharacterized protein n=3 Tax=Mycolicibacterium smegmatis TaxID=1772 RepID=A0QZ88_MYCS2|nr:hypothetical protein [Mycolicibacterium smegmatis]ABK70583.1 conserved hypothetical protein [Mycolicibacterium smegmatis MC2 155]AFP40305.1 Conserved hypothetical membrane protein [Mycolicibacterium smegmatis MC2 155]AIU09052.1 membrane protein [Mycolicibacterium smegmatis MC2 155]AIU15677.1 membrane protein [Mycolicibacterium smegmatis]AIU22300.1 membrane protein [Mycolicibacterium smegmatis]